MPSSSVMPVFRALQHAISRSHEDLAAACDSNLYALQYLSAARPAANGGAQAPLEA